MDFPLFFFSTYFRANPLGCRAAARLEVGVTHGSMLGCQQSAWILAMDVTCEILYLLAVDFGGNPNKVCHHRLIILSSMLCR